MGYYFECSACQNIHDIERPDRFSAAHLAHERQCDQCGQDGCVDCLPDTLCSSCQEEACRDAECCCDPMNCQECPKRPVWDSDTWSMTDGASD